MNAVRSFFSEVFRKHTEDDAERIVIVGAPGTIPDPATLTSECPRPWLYSRVLVFFLLTTALLFLANTLTNPGQFSNVLVIGAFAVPFTVLVLVFELNVFRNISFYTVSKALFIGGALSLIATAVLPSFWFQGITETSNAFVAGIGEEIAKLLVVYWILKRNRAYPYILNGLLVGAAVGAGFAIFETAGYGMNILSEANGPWLGRESLINLALRSFLAPGGHVVWAAISGAGMLLAMRREPLSPSVFGRKAFWAAFVIPVVLHVLWDMPFFESGWLQFGFYMILTTLAWVAVAWFVRRGLEEVKSLGAVVPYREETIVPPALAGPWRRWAARSLDQLCGGLVVMVVLGNICGYFGHGEFLDGTHQTLAWILVLPFLLLLEAIVYDLFGTTFGKWAFSLRVHDDNGRTATSKAYLKRLVRLWASGLGLGLPVVSLIALAAQHRRLSSDRKRTTYDEALGLRVDKERIHPLRWLVVLPVLLGIVILVLVAAAAADEGESPASGSGAAEPDARIRSLVQASGLKFDEGDGGLVRILFTTREGYFGFGSRDQLCLVLPEAVDDDGTECLLALSSVAPMDGLDAEGIRETMSENSLRRDLVWTEAFDCLSLRALVPLDSDPENFRRIVARLAQDADDCERERTGADDF